MPGPGFSTIPPAMSSDADDLAQERAGLFRELIDHIWPTGLTGHERFHFTILESPTAPSGVPVVMQRYEIQYPGKPRGWVIAGRSVNDLYVFVDGEGKVLHLMEES